MQTFIATGTNLTLLFCQRALSDDRPPDTRPSRENVDFEREMGKVLKNELYLFRFSYSRCTNCILHNIYIQPTMWIFKEECSEQCMTRCSGVVSCIICESHSTITAIHNALMCSIHQALAVAYMVCYMLQ